MLFPPLQGAFRREDRSALTQIAAPAGRLFLGQGSAGRIPLSALHFANRTLLDQVPDCPVSGRIFFEEVIPGTWISNAPSKFNRTLTAGSPEVHRDRSAPGYHRRSVSSLHLDYKGARMKSRPQMQNTLSAYKAGLWRGNQRHTGMSFAANN
jgi:hypothetical protein